MATPVEEYFVDAPVLRSFVETVAAMTDAEARREWVVEQLRPAFADLLRTDGWLPEAFGRPASDSGMGSGIGTYLLYRRPSLFSLMALVVPGGAATPVHDHLAWGLVGLYRGEQEEEVYRRLDDDRTPGVAALEIVERRHLRPGDFYALLPPDGDIHRVRTTSVEPSVSIHLLGNDIGCIWRHAYEPETRTVKDFRSGYTNAPCEE